MTKLAQIAQINPKLEARLADEDSVSFLGMADVSELGDTTAGETRSYRHVAKGYTPFRRGDVLVAKITPCFQNGKIAQAETEHELAFGSTEFHVVRPDSAVADARYVLHFLRTSDVREAGERRMTGSGGQRRVPRGYLDDVDVPLPPLQEQRRIAAILDQADELRAKRRRTLALLDGLQQAAFSTQFDPAATSFRVDQVGKHVSLRSGKFLPRKAMSLGEVPVFGGNGVNGHHDTAMFSEPKIVIGRVGAQCGAVHVTPEHSWVTDNAMVCTWDASALRLDYLADALRFAQLNRFAATTDLRQLSAGRVAAVSLTVPPLAVQDRYVADMRQLGDTRRGAEAHLAHLDELFASLQHRAFTGQL